MRAFLEAGGDVYELGIASSYGLYGVNVVAMDKNGDGRNELVITGGMGAAYGEVKIIGYDAGEKRWVQLLVTGTSNGKGIDLDGDGQKELVVVSGGSLPGCVWIYRWNRDHFEMADVAKATGNTYAEIHVEGGRAWVEAGEWLDGQEAEPHYYQYREGKLLEIPLPPAL